MINDIILEQKTRKDNLLKETYIPRYQTAKLAQMAENSLIKVILGPRRAGKSFFATHTFKPNEVAYVNFDDEKLSKIQNYDEIIKSALAIYGQTKFLLLDEIQNLPNWELFVNRLHRDGFNLLVTGSNSKLLSKELATHLTGRHLPLEILPFNFREYLTAKKFELPTEEKLMLSEVKGQLLNHVNNFMT